MATYVDDAFIRADVPNGSRTVRGVWSHMTADTTAELNAMADRIGLRRSWIQNRGLWSEHYDLTLSRRRLAVAAGAIEVVSLEHTREVLIPRRCPEITQGRCPLMRGHDGPHVPALLGRKTR